jgi:hypothetical protein
MSALPVSGHKVEVAAYFRNRLLGDVSGKKIRGLSGQKQTTPERAASFKKLHSCFTLSAIRRFNCSYNHLVH